MAKEKATRRKKKPILRWRGVLVDSTRTLRWMTAVVLAVAGAASTFTQLGFVEMETPDGTVAYVVVLLQIVALGSLLLGTLPGAALGFAEGAVLFLHAQVIPLDHYELAFITPLTSIIMLGVTGLLTGILFAFALRNDPPPIRRAIYIIIVCFIVAHLYCTGFAVNVIFSISFSIYERLGPEATGDMILPQAQEAAARLGDPVLQASATTVLMSLLCIIGDFAAHKALEHKGARGLRVVFGTWLGVVVALAFMVTAATSFAVTTGDELHDAELRMNEELDYIGGQYADNEKTIMLMSNLLDKAGYDPTQLDDETLQDIVDTFAADNLLRGYEPDIDGTIIVMQDGVVLMSDDDRFPFWGNTDDLFSNDMKSAIERSLETGRMQRFVFDGAMTTGSDGETTSHEYHPQIVFLLARNLDEAASDDSTPGETILISLPSSKVFENRSAVMSWTALSSLVLLLVVFAIVFQLLNRVVAQRIDEENAALARITAGELDTRVEAGGTSEFKSLTDGINATVDALRGWIAEAEARMDTELATAKAIQKAALPHIFPPFPDIDKFDIYASMVAAREVGGDFYDFFLIGDDCDAESGKLGFVVADVSGKGVPAALFMMKAKAQIHDYVKSGLELGEAITEANRQLVDGNVENMFVTAWVGVVDYGTGHIDYVNAGHNPPLLWRRESGWEWLREKSGPPLGLFELPYQAHSLECAQGDTFLLYTDGVTEAFNVDEKLFGEERLLASVERSSLEHPRVLLETVRADVAAFAKGAEQSDDITVLSLGVGMPPEVTATLKLPAERANLPQVNSFLHGELERRLCPKRVQNQLDIAVEELFVNVCSYAYPDATAEDPGFVRIQRTYSTEPSSITVVIIDEGVPYNPLDKPDAVTPDDIKDVPIGGLGILMAKRCVDEMRYEYIDGCNIVTIVKKW